MNGRYLSIHPPTGPAQFLWCGRSHCWATCRGIRRMTVPGTEIQRAPCTGYFSISSQTSSATATISTLDGVTVYLRQKLINEILLLDNYSVTFIDTADLFLSYLFHIVISHVSVRLKLKPLIDWLIKWSASGVPVFTDAKSSHLFPGKPWWRFQLRHEVDQ